jgi:hypothetical protein
MRFAITQVEFIRHTSNEKAELKLLAIYREVCVRFTTPETHPGLPLSQVLPFKDITAALSQQKFPAGLLG